MTIRHDWPHNPAARIAVSALTDLVRLIVAACGLALIMYGAFMIHPGLGWLAMGLANLRAATWQYK